MPFETVKLNDGTSMPAIAFGTGSVNKGNDVSNLVELALNTGFTHIDTAQWYQNEAYVGEGLQMSGLARSDFYVTTKYGLGPLQETAEHSLSQLGLKYVDLYLIHSPNAMPPDWEGFWREIEGLKDAGLTKSIGVSNFNLQQLQRIVKSARIKPAVNQVNFNPYNWKDNKPLLEYATKHNIVLEAYSSLTPITKMPGGPVDAPVAAAAARLGATPAQVILSWVASKGVVIVTTSSKKERMEEYLSVADLPSLTEEEIAAIDEAGMQGYSLRDRWSVKAVAALSVVSVSAWFVWQHWFH